MGKWMGMESRETTLGVYVSVPFCASKCSYCNFASAVFPRERMAPYVERLLAEIKTARRRAIELDAVFPGTIGSIYFGGGTPSLLPAELFLQIADALRGEFEFAAGVEWTVECAPGQLAADILEAMVGAGVNRISFGAQSFVDRETASVGRLHTAEQTREAVEQVRAAGIENINVDLLAGLPHQTHASWEESLKAAIALDVPHISVYMLEVDEDSRLGREMIVLGDKYHAGAVPADDAIADFYEAACLRLNAAGIAQYEISNFARDGYESRHNQRYWQREAYAGFGMDAHSCLRTHDGGAVRFADADVLGEYIDASPQKIDAVSIEEWLEEAWFLGLRQTCGVDMHALRAEFGSLAEATESMAKELAAAGLLLRDGDVYKLSNRGRMMSNDVFARFVTSGEEIHA